MIYDNRTKLINWYTSDLVKVILEVVDRWRVFDCSWQLIPRGHYTLGEEVCSQFQFAWALDKAICRNSNIVCDGGWLTGGMIMNVRRNGEELWCVHIFNIVEQLEGFDHIPTMTTFRHTNIQSWALPNVNLVQLCQTLDRAERIELERYTLIRKVVQMQK